MPLNCNLSNVSFTVENGILHLYIVVNMYLMFTTQGRFRRIVLGLFSLQLARCFLCKHWNQVSYISLILTV